MEERNLAGEYEVVLPITVDPAEGPVSSGTVELSHEDALVFLARGFVREPSGSSPVGDETPDLTVPASAGRVELIDAGYVSDEQVRAATDEQLLAIDGIAEGKLAKIRAALG